jgi:hypothetical protein
MRLLTAVTFCGSATCWITPAKCHASSPNFNKYLCCDRLDETTWDHQRLKTQRLKNLQWNCGQGCEPVLSVQDWTGSQNCGQGRREIRECYRNTCSPCGTGKYQPYSEPCKAANGCTNASLHPGYNPGYNTKCINCPGGKFAPVYSGAFKCMLCPRNKFAAEEKSAACRYCPEGKWSATGWDACQPCQPGQPGSNEHHCGYSGTGVWRTAAPTQPPSQAPLRELSHALLGALVSQGAVTLSLFSCYLGVVSLTFLLCLQGGHRAALIQTLLKQLQGPSGDPPSTPAAPSSSSIAVRLLHVKDAP